MDYQFLCSTTGISCVQNEYMQKHPLAALWSKVTARGINSSMKRKLNTTSLKTVPGQIGIDIGGKRITILN
jgi:hypothetical protein